MCWIALHGDLIAGGMPNICDALDVSMTAAASLITWKPAPLSEPCHFNLYHRKEPLYSHHYLGAE